MNDSVRWYSHRRYLYLLAKVVFFSLFVLGAWWFLGRLSNIVIPLFISMLIAYLFDPMVDWFENKGVNRTLAIAFMMMVGLGTVTLFLVLITPTLVEEVSLLYTEKLPRFFRDVQAWYLDTQMWIEQRTGYTLPKTVGETFSDYRQKIQDLATSAVQEAFQRVTTVTTQFLSGTWAVLAYLFNAALVPLFTFYFLRDFDKYKHAAHELVPLPRRESVVARARRVDGVVGHWFRGQVTVAAILMVLYTIGLAICGVKLWYAIGIFAGILSIIPYLGFIIGIGLALLMSALDDGSGWGQIFGVLAVFTVVQIAEGYVITPKIVGEKVGLSPVMVIIVLLVGAELFGFLGVLLAIPAAAVLRVFALEIISEYKRSRLFLGERNFLNLLADGPSTAGREVRESLRQSAEAALDIKLPAVLTTQELTRIQRGEHLDDLIVSVQRKGDEGSDPSDASGDEDSEPEAPDEAT
jgi:predicted PurR-regulated permease PerM